MTPSGGIPGGNTPQLHCTLPHANEYPYILFPITELSYTILYPIGAIVSITLPMSPKHVS
jgi:hypothetical protein